VVNRAKRAPMSGAPSPRMKKAMRVWVSLGVNPVAKESARKIFKPTEGKIDGKLDYTMRTLCRRRSDSHWVGIKTKLTYQV